ncbi:MAG: pyridoxal phosphate-dependent aminotransferase family protein [Prolixibacteraceae bacterium]
MITLDSEVDNYITLNNERYSYFAGNDYLGLANHPDFIQTATAALQKYGINFAASRKTTGTSDIHLQLEKALAGYKGTDDAVVFASGYLGNRLLLEALRDRYTAVFADAQAHPSIREGIPHSITSVYYYEHCNTGHLELILKEHPGHRPLIITDGVFALTGEIAPLDRIAAIARKYRAPLIVDDAHSTGILGDTGKGTPEYFGLAGADNIFQSETMSKAIGGYGGFIAANRQIIAAIREKSLFYGASTALPPPLVAAGSAAVTYLSGHPELRIRVLENARRVREGLLSSGFETSDSIMPIIPVFFDRLEKAKDLSAFLKENLIIAPAVDYPVKTGRCLVRVTVSANHSTGQIDHLLAVLKQWKDRPAG